MEDKDTLEAVLEDAEKVFSFMTDCRPQERAHRYLTKREVNRGFNDTAMLCVVNDLVRRAHALGVEDGKQGAEPVKACDGGLARALLVKSAGELLVAAEKLGE